MEGQKERAALLKEEGNTLYKRGDLEGAVVRYNEAAQLQPDDPVFYSNASAALFEVCCLSSYCCMCVCVGVLCFVSFAFFQGRGPHSCH